MFVIINRAESNLNDIGTRSQLKYLTAPQHTNHIAKDYFWKCFPSYSFFLLKTSEKLYHDNSLAYAKQINKQRNILSYSKIFRQIFSS